ncbi:ribokinase [Paenisporosarcina antarctica]|uniref:Ribokinase n=1 Tax=Paenisporosarcina antarctica TaxID=417367 RepID=A0A4P7A1D6_9BACL|nr:ribokinase [Paenisporosarcina antarctica]QBP42652.1 ribokinase [Paenisporosarcina antarctica]
MAKIAVIGSINMDLVVETDISPKKGETVLGSNFFASPGGKGANQAVAAARLGGEVTMFGSIGKDQNGEILLANLLEENIDTTYINILDNIPTGVAVIEICEKDNRIVVVPGANKYTNEEYLTKVAESLVSFDVILMQLEVPLESIVFMTKYLSPYDKIIILNPAPAIAIPEEVLTRITYITPNEHEYLTVLNTSSSIEETLRKFPTKLLITCGEKGVVYCDGNSVITVPSIKVDVVDTTGAGDTFTGAFGVAISEGRPLREAILFANTAAGLSTTKMGAQKGMPTREDVENN